MSHGVTTNACNRPWSEFEQPVDRPSQFDRPRNKRWIFKCLLRQREFQVEKCTYRRCTGKDYKYVLMGRKDYARGRKSPRRTLFPEKKQLLFHIVGRKKGFSEGNKYVFSNFKYYRQKRFHVSFAIKVSNITEFLFPI